MSETSTAVLPGYLAVGRLTRDYLILPDGQAFCDVPGGNALYAAVGMAVWTKDPAPGLVARVGEDYPLEWLQDFAQAGLDVRGVCRLQEPLDLRNFMAFSDRRNFFTDDPVRHFAEHGQAFPKSLLGYHPWLPTVDSRTRLLPSSVRPKDIPPFLMDVGVAHICPLDYLAHSLLPAAFRQAAFTTLTLDPSPAYMIPTFWDDVPALVNGLTAFLPSDEEVMSLFKRTTTDLWEMSEALAAYGCEIIVIKCGERGQLVYDAASHKRWEIPAYPSRFVNPLGAGDAFCGGFLVGYRLTYDPLQAALYGNISASLVVEGHPALYALDALPGLAEARRLNLQESVRAV